MDEAPGKIDLVAPDVLEAGSWTQMRFRYTAGPDGIAGGGGIEIVFMTSYPTNSWSIPQTELPLAPGYTTARVAEGSGGGSVRVEIVPVPSVLNTYSLSVHIVRVTCGVEGLAAGSVVEVVYGDRSFGSRGAQVQLMARRVEFPVYVDEKGYTTYESRKLTDLHGWFRCYTRIEPIRKVVHFLPAVTVRGAKARRLKVVAPMRVKAGEPFTLKVAARDACSNLAAGFAGRVEISCTGGELGGVPSAVAFGEGDGGVLRVDGLKLSSAGTARISVVAPGTGIAGVSNPVVVTDDAPAHGVYFGDIHCHTELSDGNGTPDEHYAHSRDAEGLDFGAVSDHLREYWEDDVAKWPVFVDAAERYDEPGEYATLIAYESTMVRAAGQSHMSLYSTDPKIGLVNTYDNENVIDDARAAGWTLIPHHTGYSRLGMGLTSWEVFDPEITPAIEVFSAHGSSECEGALRPLVDPQPGSFVADGLARGWRFGFVASSDYHMAFMGEDIDLREFPGNLNCRHFQFRTGYVAALLGELTRDALMDAIRNRRTYATTGCRIYLELTAAGRPMGSEIDLSAGEEFEINAHAEGTDVIDRIEIVSGGRVEVAETPGAMGGRIAFRTAAPPAGSTDYYYVRVVQVDGEMAWSSPVYITGK